MKKASYVHSATGVAFLEEGHLLFSSHPLGNGETRPVAIATGSLHPSFSNIPAKRLCYANGFILGEMHKRGNAENVLVFFFFFGSNCRRWAIYCSYDHSGMRKYRECFVRGLFW